jgi:hypothetical protein
MCETLNSIPNTAKQNKTIIIIIIIINQPNKQQTKSPAGSGIQNEAGPTQKHPKWHGQEPGKGPVAMGNSDKGSFKE